MLPFRAEIRLFDALVRSLMHRISVKDSFYKTNKLINMVA